jgi:DNA repair exonuclease SbcCD ATPase subunit
MEAFSCCGVGRSLVVGFALLFAVPVLGDRAFALTDVETTNDVIAPVEEFSRELDRLKQNFGELSKKIDESAKAIDNYTDAQKARKEIEDLRTAVAGLLDSVADNGAVATLGDKALARARDKLRLLEQDSRFKPEERNFLIEQWRQLRDDTERANQELGSARTRFVELLRTLQTNEDFIDELIQIRQAQKVIDVIHQLTRDIRGASDQLQHLIGGIKRPGA